MNKYLLSIIVVLIILIMGLIYKIESTNFALDYTIATINSTEIKSTEFENILKQNMGQIIINEMIDQKLIYEAARNSNIFVTENEINKKINFIAESNGESLEEFFDIIERNGATIDLLKNDVKADLLLEKLVLPTLPDLSEEYLLNYYEENKEELYIEGNENPTFKEAKETIKNEHEYINLQNAKKEWIERTRESADIKIYL